MSVPQGIIGLMTRFGMDVTLAHPDGYEAMSEVEDVARENAKKSGGSFTRTNSMAEAFKDADIVYPKIWAPFAAMEKRTQLYGKGDAAGINALEKELLAQNACHKDWSCTEELMKTTKDGKALYLHCLPADISGVSCTDGEVDASVFDRYRTPLYNEASYKPYIIAAVEKVALHLGEPQETWLEEITAAQAENYAAQGHFAPGSMLPKVQARISFAASAPGRTALSALLQKAKDGINGKTGTRIVG